MALTFNLEKRTVRGNERVWKGEIVFDSAYPDNGEAVAASDFNFSILNDIDISGIAYDETNDHGLNVFYDKTNEKLVLAEGSGGTAGPLPEIGADNVAEYAVRITAYGI